MNTLFLLMTIVGFIVFPILSVVFILSFFMKRLRPYKKKIIGAMAIGFLMLIVGAVNYEPSPEAKAQAAKQAEEAKKEKEAKAKEQAEKEEKKKAEQQAEKEKKAEEKAQKEAEEEKKKKDKEEAERLKAQEAEKKKVEEEQRKAQEAEKKKVEEDQRKAQEAELTTLPFEEFLNKYYALSADENSKFYDENIHKKVFTWSGYVADVFGSKVVVNTKPIVKQWGEFTGEEQAHTFIASFDNKKELANAKPGDKITVSGSVESRGAYMPEKELYSYWKMYKGKLIK
ncbi:cell division protein ZapC [Bacillus pacificus]|uniref:cell division protein ZapC n=1 Tax=Bacillus pacificus TaxID=2026187 RepID=UPI00355694B5